MKKQFLFLAVAILLLTLNSSCKKWYTCTCTASGGALLWTNQVEGTSKTQVQNSLTRTDGDCYGGVGTCN